MSAATITVLQDLHETQSEIKMALASGDVPAALGAAQCLWAFCGCANELAEHLGHIRQLALQHRSKLTLDACSQLNAGLNEVEYIASKERLLVPASA